METFDFPSAKNPLEPFLKRSSHLTIFNCAGQRGGSGAHLLPTGGGSLRRWSRRLELAVCPVGGRAAQVHAVPVQEHARLIKSAHGILYQLHFCQRQQK